MVGKRNGSLRGKDVCTICNGLKIIIAEPDSKIAANLGAGNEEERSHFLLYICARCGHTELFLRKDYRKPAWDYFKKKKQELVEQSKESSCPHCGLPVEATDSKFCPNCGQSL